MSRPLSQAVVIGFLVLWFAGGVGIGVYGERADGRRAPQRNDRLWYWWRVLVVYDLVATLLTVPVMGSASPSRHGGFALGAAGVVFALGITGFCLLLWRGFVPIAGGSMPPRVYVRLATRYFGLTLAISVVGLVPLMVLSAARVGP